MMHAQLGARDTFIMGLLRDKVLVEEQNRVRAMRAGQLLSCMVHVNTQGRTLHIPSAGNTNPILPPQVLMRHNANLEHEAAVVSAEAAADPWGHEAWLMGPR